MENEWTDTSGNPLVVTRGLLLNLLDNTIELLNENEWRRNSTTKNSHYIKSLEQQIELTEKLLKK